MEFRLRLKRLRKATLLDDNGGLASGSIVTNAGTLTTSVADTIATYTSNGGTLTNDPGQLTATTVHLNTGSSIAGFLSATGLLTRNGTVSVSGTVTAPTIDIASGTLTDTGTFGTSATHLGIGSGATFVASGTQHYGLLTTSGPGTGTWQGTLANTTTIAPGGDGGFGTLLVNGSFTQPSTGILKFDVSSSQHDLLQVTGSATFGGTLELNKSGLADIAPFVPINLVAAGSYAGNVTSISQDLGSAVLFNPATGDITLPAAPTASNGRLFGSTANQTSTWISLYDDVTDPGINNVTLPTKGHPGYGISSGVASTAKPDLLWALTASLVPVGLNAPLLDRLSPEVYTAFSDYAVQATRTHQRTALSAPALASVTQSGWEFFAAADFFNAQTDRSLDLGDYEMSGTGIITGARTRLSDRVVFGAYFAADLGSVDGQLINAGETGWSMGAFSQIILDPKTHTILTAAISYGRYGFDGSRGSASATASGWVPGLVDYSNVDSDSLELFLGVEGVAWHNDRIRIMPSAGIRYVTDSMNKFAEATGAAPGSPIALNVERTNHDALLFEMGLCTEIDLTHRLTAWGQIGLDAGMNGDNPRSIDAAFVQGSRLMRAQSEGLGDDLLFIGLGLDYRLSDSVSLGIGYRSEFRQAHPAEQGCNVSSTFRF